MANKAYLNALAEGGTRQDLIDWLVKLDAEVDRLRPNWRPIETAQKRGRRMGRYGKRVTIIGWSDRWERWTDLGPEADHNKQPDAWMPIPSAEACSMQDGTIPYVE